MGRVIRAHLEEHPRLEFSDRLVVESPVEVVQVVGPDDQVDAQAGAVGAVAALRNAFIEANATIHNKGQQNREFEGMGTTTTALVLRPEGLFPASSR